MTTTFPTTGDFGYEGGIDEDINLFGLRMPTENAFNFESQALSPSCPSTSGSFSSTSSPYGPFTPTSRTPTPQQHFTFGGSFDDGSINITDFTPPPSATSVYFPLDLKSTVVPAMLTDHGMPSTPSRCNNLFDNTLPPHGGLDFTPSRDMDPFSFDDGMSSPQFFVPSSVPPFDNTTSNFEPASIWEQHTDSSPITFSSPSMHFMTPVSSPSNSSSGHNRRRVAMDGPQLRSNMLLDLMTTEDFMKEAEFEQYQARRESTFSHVPQTPTKSRASKPRPAIGRSSSRSQPSYAVHKGRSVSKKNTFKEFRVEESPRGRFACAHPDCTRIYTRHEHLKRHELEHSPNPEYYVCEFCPGPEPKKFIRNRLDNFIDHVGRHFSGKPGVRTNQHPLAEAFLARLKSESKSNKTNKTKKPREAKSGKGAMEKPRKAVKTGATRTEAMKTAPIKRENMS